MGERKDEEDEEEEEEEDLQSAGSLSVVVCHELVHVWIAVEREMLETVARNAMPQALRISSVLEEPDGE